MMGYGCYKLASGKEAGYLVDAVCEHPGCSEKIDRGLAYACGGDAGEQGGCSCEGYFCGNHTWVVEPVADSHAQTELGRSANLCAQCVSLLAFMDMIDEAEIYRADLKFRPNDETMRALRLEECQHLGDLP